MTDSNNSIRRSWQSCWLCILESMHDFWINRASACIIPYHGGFIIIRRNRYAHPTTVSGLPYIGWIEKSSIELLTFFCNSDTNTDTDTMEGNSTLLFITSPSTNIQCIIPPISSLAALPSRAGM